MSLVPYGAFTKLLLKNAPNDTYGATFQNAALSADAVITVPNFATNTLASANNAQTFSGLQTMSSGIQLGVAGTPTGYALSTLNYYEVGSFTANFDTGMKTGTNNITVNFVRIGQIITLYFPSTSVTANATSAFWGTSATDLPVRLRPSGGRLLAMTLLGLSAYDTGRCQIASTGELYVYRQGATWTSGDTGSGFPATCVTYMYT